MTIRAITSMFKAVRIETAGLIFVLTAMLAVPSHGAKDSLKRGMQLYKKHLYEDAIKLLSTHPVTVGSDRQDKTNLAMGMVCLANASLYRDLYHTSRAANLDYLTRLLSAEGPSVSHLANFYLGQTLLEAGRPTEAAAFFSKFLAENNIKQPDKDLATISLGTAFYLMNEQTRARDLWSKVKKNQPELLSSLAAAYSRVGIEGKKPLAMCQNALDLMRQSDRAPSIQIINHLIGIYAGEGLIDEGFELIQQTDLKGFFHEEVPAKNKVIRFYESALLENLSLFYGKAALRFLELAHSSTDKKIKNLAQYYLGEGYGLYGSSGQSMHMLNAFISSANNPSRLKNMAKARQAFNQYLLGNEEVAQKQLDALMQLKPEPNLIAEILLSCIRYKFDASQIVIYASEIAQRGQGKAFARINFALGKYYLSKNDHLKAISYMEAARDKSNKNRVEFNDPLMLVNLAQAYCRSKQFSEALEIFFEMSKQFPAIRQIQVALQGVYIMEQKSAGEVKIF